MSFFDKLKKRAIDNSHVGGPFSVACATAITKLEQKRIDRKLKKMENDVCD